MTDQETSGEIIAARELLIDCFGRIDELVSGLTGDLDTQTATFRPEPEANSIAWLIWHSARVQDDHVAGIAGVDQVWPTWRDRFDLPFDDFATGYGMSSQDVGKVVVDAELLAGYHHDVHAQTLRYLESLTLTELERVVDENWDPPVTVSVRLVSVINDATQHIGQAAYLKGLAANF